MKGFDEWLDNHGNPGYETFHDIGRDLRAERKTGVEINLTQPDLVTITNDIMEMENNLNSIQDDITNLITDLKHIREVLSDASQ